MPQSDHNSSGGPEIRRVLTLFGTRPEVIKLAPVVRALEARPGRFQTLNVASGQHAHLLHPFAREFSLRIDVDLEVASERQSPADVCRRVLEALTPLLGRERPDALLVQGDTVTAFAGALAGFYQGVAVGHVEAGLRSGDVTSPYPEEMNRRLITQLASFHFAATEYNAETLRREGVSRQRIVVTGNPVVDAVRWALADTAPSERVLEIVRWVGPRKLVVLTTHRRESFGSVMGDRLKVLRSFIERHPDTALLFPVHLNPAVQESARRELAGAQRIRCVEPLEYLEFIHLLAHSWLIVSDSGGVQEEAPSVGKPVLVIRDNTERKEAIEAGVARLVGRSTVVLETLLEEAYADSDWFQRARQVDNPFGDGAGGDRIADALDRLLDGRPASDQ
jgi:UDP-N-acetylglucosamine 2-epimerase (non-hydrolysing)